MRNRSRLKRLGTLALVVLVLGGLPWPVGAQQDLAAGIQDLVKQMVASMEQQRKRKLAILDFTKLDGSVDNFGRYLAERLVTAMFLSRQFDVIERRQLDKILAELRLNLSDLIDPQNAQRLGRVHGVDAIASGSVSELAVSVEVNGRLIETETGRVFAVATTRFAKDKDVIALLGGGPSGVAQPGAAASGAAAGPAKGVVVIPAGEFIYGPEGKEQRISLPTFYIDVHEVTNADYARVRPHDYPPGKANHPVVNVSWHDAKRYCEAIGKRLPTAHEWEKAARGTDGRHFPWGDTYDASKLNAEGRFSGTTPVGQFPSGRSPYGVLDLAGNVMEWTSSDYEGPWANFRGVKLIRGGSWKHGSNHVRVDAWWGADNHKPQLRSDDLGFRCAKDSP